MDKKICRVLVVEDNEEIQDLLEDTFVGEGYRFSVAGSGAEMRAALAQGDVDVVVIDVLLRGGENGLVLAREAAAQGCGVILVTGHPEQLASLQHSGHPFLAKPFRLTALLQLVDRVLRETRAKCEVKGRRYGS
jgi:two-component system, OmpR family, response regulator